VYEYGNGEFESISTADQCQQAVIKEPIIYLPNLFSNINTVHLHTQNPDFQLYIPQPKAIMSLAPQLSAVYDNFQKNAPVQIVQTINGMNSDFEAAFKNQCTIKVGDKLPSFALSDALGKEVTSDELLKKGPLLISFYRGEWCPFCNLALRSLQLNLDKFQAKGVTLVAISPELSNTSLSTTEKNELKFPVLSDVGNNFARELGIIFSMPDSIRPAFKAFGHDLVARNGDDSLEVPVPATLLVDGQGVVRNTYINPHYWERVEPSTVLEWIDGL
jgi:peroxiredoxin